MKASDGLAVSGAFSPESDDVLLIGIFTETKISKTRHCANKIICYSIKPATILGNRSSGTFFSAPSSSPENHKSENDEVFHDKKSWLDKPRFWRIQLAAGEARRDGERHCMFFPKNMHRISMV